MKRREFLAGAVLAPALLTLRQEPDETGFVRLFDSTSLDGWSVADGPESAFYVDDGAMRGAPERGLPRVAAVRAPVRELRLPRRVLRAGLDEFRHLPARARTRPQHLVRDEDQHLPPGGRDAGARVDGIDLSAGASAQGEREERVEHVPHPDGLAASPSVDQRRRDSGSGRRGRAGTAPPAAQRVLRARVDHAPDPVPRPARARVAVEGLVDAVVRDGGGLRQVAHHVRQADLPGARRRAARRWRRRVRHQRDIPRFRAAEVRPARPASQRRRHVRRPGERLGRPALRDPAHGRGGRALCHGVALRDQARAVSPDRAREVVAVPASSERSDVHRPHQRRHGAGVPTGWSSPAPARSRSRPTAPDTGPSTKQVRARRI